MIPFRHHVVSLVAVFLALAVGIVLGGGVLAGRDTTDAGTRPAAGSGSAGSDDGGAADGAGSAASDGGDGAGGTDQADGGPTYAVDLAVAAGARAAVGSLGPAAVAVVTMPGADPAVVSALVEQVTATGSRVTGTFAVSDQLLDPAQQPLLDSLGAQLLPQVTGVALDPAAPTYDRVGQLVGVATATGGQRPVPASPETSTVRDALAGAGLLAGPTVAVAPLLLVVLGDGADQPEGGAQTQAAVVAGLARTAAGVVVAGDAAGSDPLTAVRAATLPGVVATVDGVGAPLGQVSAVLALAEVLAGRGGAFGAASGGDALPLG